MSERSWVQTPYWGDPFLGTIHLDQKHGAKIVNGFVKILRGPKIHVWTTAWHFYFLISKWEHKHNRLEWAGSKTAEEERTKKM
jgi:hypothetical protein